MNKISQQQFQEIINLIDNKKWDEAEKFLLKLSQTGNSIVYYLLGLVHDEWDNPNKNKEKAKKYFTLAAESSSPVEDAFIRLSRNEKSRTHSIRILRKGLKSFPKSESIYKQLFFYTEPSERENIYKEIIEKECVSEQIKIRMVVTFFELKEYKKIIEGLSDVEAKEEWDRNILACIKGFSLYAIGNYTEASKIFSMLIEEDINHNLNYIPHLGLVLILLNQDKLPKAEKLFEEIPLDVENSKGAYPILEPGPWGYSYLDATEYFLRAIELILMKTKKKEIMGIARGLRGLFLYSQAFEEDTTKKGLQSSVRKDLEVAFKVFPQNKEISKCLWQVFKVSNPYRAWNYLVKYVSNGDEDIYEYDEFIENLNDQIFEEILNDFKEKLSKNNYIVRNFSPLLKPIIDRLFKAKRYKDILAIINKFNESHLAERDIIFKTAYSYFEEDNLSASKKYYELYLSKNEESTAALNNLGLIYEKIGNLLKAQELFQKAVQIDNKDEDCRKNLKRVGDEIKKNGRSEYELKEAVEKFLKESPFIQKKILDFVSHKNEDGLIVCSYRQAPQLLKMNGIKAADFLNDIILKKFF